MTLVNKKYTENFAQENQVKVLINKRIDVAISDKNIFLSSLSSHGILKDGEKIFNFHSIGKPTKRTIRFLDKKLRDSFNKGLKIIRKNGSYKKILKKYSLLYSDKC